MKRRKSPPTKFFYHQHTKGRLAERYGIALNRKLHDHLVHLIQIGKCTLLERETHSRSLYLVEVASQKVPVIYSHSQRRIVTALPYAGWIQEKEYLTRPL